MGELQTRVFRSKREKEAVASGKLIESINTLPPQAFFTRYSSSDTFFDSEGLPRMITVCGSGEELKGNVLDQCFDLIEKTSADDYRASEMKWSPTKKRKEMLLPDMRYIVLQSKDETEERHVAGFVSFMITYEDGHEVVYCYEVHLAESWQGKGTGKRLMRLVEDIGRKIGVEKAMLTVFKSNVRAMKMYESLGYVEDEYSPGPRILRNGAVKEPTYAILSKRLRKG